MNKRLFPVDDSEASVRALSQWLAAHPAQAGEELHLLNVQLPVDGNVRSFVNTQQLNDYHRDEGLAALAPARRLLDEAGRAYQHHVLVGHPATTIVRFATEQRMDEIVMGAYGHSGWRELLMGSVATKVKAEAPMPVTLMR